MTFRLSLLLFVLSIGIASAQQEATLALRDGKEISGIIVSVTSDSVYLAQPLNLHYADRTEAIPTFAFSRGQIRTISIGGGPSVLIYTLLGFGGGAVAGAVTAMVLTSGDEHRGEHNSISEAFEPLARAVVVTVCTLGGTVLGLLYGLFSNNDGTVFDMSVEADYELLRNAYVGATADAS